MLQKEYVGYTNKARVLKLSLSRHLKTLILTCIKTNHWLTLGNACCSSCVASHFVTPIEFAFRERHKIILFIINIIEIIVVEDWLITTHSILNNEGKAPARSACQPRKGSAYGLTLPPLSTPFSTPSLIPIRIISWLTNRAMQCLVIWQETMLIT